MLNTRYVREHIEEIRSSLERRKSDFPIDELLELDRRWRADQAASQKLHAERNRRSLEVAKLKKSGEDAGALVSDLARLKKEITAVDASLASYSKRIDELLWSMPNVLDRHVPYGESEEQNVEIRKWGKVDELRGSAGHEEILERLGMLEIAQAASVAGARFYYLKGEIALLELALIRFAVDELARKGYTPITPPFMLRREFYRGATSLADFEEALYRVAEPAEASSKEDYERLTNELYLISTSEHAIAALHAGEVLRYGDLPKRYAGISPCFRREAGSRSKDTKGIFRVHQFYKVEQYVFCKPEESEGLFYELLENTESLVQALGLPYRVLEFCTGAIGTVASRKNDVEVYMYGQGAYREIGSCSNCTDWQSLRLDIRYDDNGDRHYVHTLNSTAIPTTRMIVAIAEAYANADGTITVPDALVPYMGKDKIGAAGGR